MAEPFRFHAQDKTRPGLALKHVLAGRIKLAELLGAGEKEFRERVKSAESHPLFRRLSRPGNRAERAITFSRPYRFKLADSFLQFKDEIAAGGGPADVQSMLEGREATARAIKAIGEEKFKEYFLFNESGAGASEAARACGISPEQAADIMEFVDELAVQGEFCGASDIASEKGMIYTKIAGIEKDAGGGVVIVYRIPHLAKGKYSIDYDKINALKKHGLFTKEESVELSALIKQLEAINIRKSVMHRVMENVIELQKEFLGTERAGALKPLSQKTVSKRIGINPSLVNRAIYARSVSTPSGAEMPLKDFFPSKKDVVKGIVREIFREEKAALRDETVSALVTEKCGFRVSRHLIQIYRSELGIPPAGKRKG